MTSPVSPPVAIGSGETSPSVHKIPAAQQTSAAGVPNIAKQLQASAAFIIEGILGQVLIAFGGVQVFGIKPFAALSVLGQSIVSQANAAYANSVTAKATATAADTKSNNIIDALVSGLTGSTNTGNDPTSLALALINQGLALPLQVIDQINASLAALQAQLNGVQNSPAGTVVSDDFATVGVGGYTNIVGTLAVSASGPYVQTQNVAVGYRNAAQLTDKHGAQITIDGTMHGCSGIGICSDTTASNYAALFVYSGFGGDSIWLSTGSGPKLSVIQAQADQILPRVSNTNVYETWYEPSVNTFHVLRNGVSIITWVDTTNIVTHSSTKRRILLFSNVFDRTEVGFRSPGIRKVNPYDKA